MKTIQLPNASISTHCRRYEKMNLARVMSKLSDSFATKVFDEAFQQPLNQ